MSQLWLPPSVRPKFTCLVPTENGPCGAQFMEQQHAAYEAHVAKCAKRHEKEIHEASPVTRMPLIFGKWDAEYEDYVRDTGKT